MLRRQVPIDLKLRNSRSRRLVEIKKRPYHSLSQKSGEQRNGPRLRAPGEEPRRPIDRATGRRRGEDPPEQPPQLFSTAQHALLGLEDVPDKRAPVSGA